MWLRECGEPQDTGRLCPIDSVMSFSWVLLKVWMCPLADLRNLCTIALGGPNWDFTNFMGKGGTKITWGWVVEHHIHVVFEWNGRSSEWIRSMSLPFLLLPFPGDPLTNSVPAGSNTWPQWRGSWSWWPDAPCMVRNTANSQNPSTQWLRSVVPKRTRMGNRQKQVCHVSIPHLTSVYGFSVHVSDGSFSKVRFAHSLYLHFVGLDAFESACLACYSELWQALRAWHWCQHGDVSTAEIHGISQSFRHSGACLYLSFWVI